MEGSDGADYRLLKGVKNRFGSTSEVGVFEMGEEGLVDVKNPSELFLSEGVLEADGDGAGGRDGDMNRREGSAVAVLMEGSRPILAEIQCLVSTASPKTNTKRMSDGFPVQVSLSFGDMSYRIMGDITLY